MTREEILNMPAGREMDALIEKWKTGVLAHYPPVWEEWHTQNGSDGGEGFICPRCKVGEDDYEKYPCAKNYSGNMSATFEVMEKLSLTDWVIEKAGDHYCVNLMVISVCAETIPLAICRAALLVELEEK